LRGSFFTFLLTIAFTVHKPFLFTTSFFAEGLRWRWSCRTPPIAGAWFFFFCILRSSPWSIPGNLKKSGFFFFFFPPLFEFSLMFCRVNSACSSPPQGCRKRELSDGGASPFRSGVFRCAEMPVFFGTIFSRFRKSWRLS